MPKFDFCKNLIGIPDEWKQTGGKNVKIALLDTGANLNHPALQHLDVSGRKFDVTLPDFEVTTATGDDPVPDTAPGSDLHGTQLLSIMAANPSDDFGVKGLAPDAEYFIIKIINSERKTLATNYLKAIELCHHLDVDIISNSAFPRKDDRSVLPIIDAAFQKLAEKNILFVSALKNSELPARFNKIVFPTNQPNAIVTGVPQRLMLKKIDTDFEFNEGIHFFFPELKVTSFSDSDKSTGKTFLSRSSHATAGLSAVLALYLSHKKEPDVNFERPTKAEVISELQNHCADFSKNTLMGGNAPFQFFKTK